MPNNNYTSPPAAATASTSSVTHINTSLQHSASAPDLNPDILLTPENLYSGVTQRAKRMRSADSQDSQDDKLNIILTEMKLMFSNFTERQERQDAKIEKIYEEIKKHNSEIQASLEFMSHKYDSLVVQIEKLESERKANKSYIELLENKLEKLEKKSRSACLEIRNIPGTNPETKQTLLNKMISLGEALSVNIQLMEINDIFRVKSKEPISNRTIIVELTSVLLKEKLIQNYRKLNKKFRLTTETL